MCVPRIDEGDPEVRREVRISGALTRRRGEEQDELDAVVDVQRLVDGLGVIVDGVAAAAELRGDLGLGETFEQELEHAVLGRADQTGQVGTGRDHALTERLAGGLGLDRSDGFGGGVRGVHRNPLYDFLFLQFDRVGCDSLRTRAHDQHM